MSIKDMWKTNALRLVLMIVVNLALMSVGSLPWMVLGLLVLLAGMYFAFRQGMGFGHEACGILDSVRRIQASEGPGRDQLDDKVLARAWSPECGLKGVLVSALIPYVTGCIYIVAALLNLNAVLIPARVIALILALPFWPILIHWYETFDQLRPAIAVLLMVSPFVLPACFYAGYMQGPRLWKRSEQAMAQGLRRAKAKSRIVRKRTPKPQKPEI